MARGFTLVETMAVLAIAGVLTSLAVVGLRDASAAGSETRAARSLVQVLKRARTTALSQHVRVGVELDEVDAEVSLRSCPQRYGDDACVAGAASVVVGPVLSWRRDFAGVQMTAPAIDGDGHVVAYAADGRPRTAGRFVVDHPLTPGVLEVRVTVAGDVRIEAIGADDAR